MWESDKLGLTLSFAAYRLLDLGYTPSFPHVSFYGKEGHKKITELILTHSGCEITLDKCKATEQE